jgi:siroheme synthase
VSAALAAPAAAGIPVTHRGVAGSVAFVTGHRVGGDPSALEALAQSVDTLVILMPAELEAIAGRLSSVLGPDRPSAIISQATTADQLVVRAPIGSIAAAAQAARVVPPSTLVVGDVVYVLSGIGDVAGTDPEMFAEAVASRG